MTHEVVDQFLRRRDNQFYFGFFIGLALYALITLATVSGLFNPVFGATLAFLLTAVALYLLLLLLYGTVNQMRPVEIAEALHDYTLEARKRQLPLIHQTRRVAQSEGAARAPVRLERHGFVTEIDVRAIATAVKEAQTEVVFFISIGAYVAFGDVIAEVRAQTLQEAEAVGKAVQKAVRLERQRNLMLDPAYGLEQLEMIAWTSVSTAKSNPAAGQKVIRALRDVMARWAEAEKAPVDEKEPEEEPLPIVYTDNVAAKLFSTFETLAIVSSESMQHQNFIEVTHTFTVMFERMPKEWQDRVEDLISRTLSALGDLVLTAELEAALSDLAQTLSACGRTDAAMKVRTAKDELARSVGKLNSRATRVPGSA